MSGFQIYEDKASLWRWRFVADNGRVMADSGEGYDSRGNVSQAVSRFKQLVDRASPEPQSPGIDPLATTAGLGPGVHSNAEGKESPDGRDAPQ